MSRLFYAMTMPGLEMLAFNELRSRVADAEQVKFARGIVLFTTTASPVRLLSARTTEDIFFALAHVRSLGHGRDALRVLHSATLHADLSSALTHWCPVHGVLDPLCGVGTIVIERALQGPFEQVVGEIYAQRLCMWRDEMLVPRKYRPADQFGMLVRFPWMQQV